METEVKATPDVRPRKEAAQAMQLSLGGFDRHLKAGHIRAVRLGGKVMVPTEEIARVLREGLPVPPRD